MTTTRAGRSAHAFIDHPDGFMIVGWQDAVRVRLRHTHWVLERRDHSLDIPLFPFGLVLANIVNMFCEQRYWFMRRLDDGDRAKDELRRSIKRDTHRLHRELGKRVYRRLRRLLRRGDPVMLAVHRANSSSLAEGMALAVQDYAAEGRIPMSEIIRDPDVRRDILAYPAAAIAAGHLLDLVADWLDRVVPDLAGKPATVLDDPVRSEEIAARHPLFACEDGLDLLRQWMEDRRLHMSGALMSTLRYWRDLFSPSGVSDPSLRRTLEAVPDDIPDALICALRQVRLRRPLTDRLELLVATFVGVESGIPRRGPVTLARNADVILGARHGDIVSAMRLLSVYLGRNLNPKRDRDVAILIKMLLVSRFGHPGSLVGLTERAIAWDLEMLEQVRRETLRKLGASTPSALPPIPLPTTPGVRFLATVAEIADLGLELRNGLGLFAGQAVQGELYVFHVRHDGDDEAVLVTAGGSLHRDLYSPTRMTWGEKILQAWAEELRPAPSSETDDCSI